MPTPEEIEAEREHLRSLAAQAKREMADLAPPPEEFGEESAEQQALVDEMAKRIEEVAGEEDHGYDLNGHAHDDRTPVKTAFLVFVDPQSGRAIATSDVEETMAAIRIEAEASVVDMRRYMGEAIEDIRILLTSQSILTQQMAMARQAAEAAESARVAQNLGDLRDVRSRRK